MENAFRTFLKVDHKIDSDSCAAVTARGAAFGHIRLNPVDIRSSKDSLRLVHLGPRPDPTAQKLPLFVGNLSQVAERHVIGHHRILKNFLRLGLNLLAGLEQNTALGAVYPTHVGFWA